MPVDQRQRSNERVSTGPRLFFSGPSGVAPQPARIKRLLKAPLYGQRQQQQQKHLLPPSKSLTITTLDWRRRTLDTKLTYAWPTTELLLHLPTRISTSAGVVDPLPNRKPGNWFSPRAVSPFLFQFARPLFTLAAPGNEKTTRHCCLSRQTHSRDRTVAGARRPSSASDPGPSISNE